MTTAPAPIILIVDDDAPLAKLIGEWLGLHGFQIFYAADGIGAVMQALKHKPNLIILDYTMPAANGATVYQRLASSKETAHIPILFLTSYPLEALEKVIPKSPRIRVLGKPTDMKAIKAQIDELLQLPPPQPPSSNQPTSGPPPLTLPPIKPKQP